MDQQPATTSSFPWTKLVGLALVIASSAYAAQHPHSFLYHLVKFLFAPIP